MPGRCRPRRPVTSPLTCAAPHVDGPARRRELHGVREQVEDHLPDPPLVARDDVDAGDRCERDLDAVLQRALAHHHDAALERVLQRERRDLELDLPGLDLGQVEDVVDQRQQVVARGEDVLEVLRLLLVELAEELLAEHLREADDRVQRRPQLVRHVGQELRLVPARRLELAALLVQLGECRLELAGPLLDLLLEARIGLLEPRRHAIELLRERSELVVARYLDRARRARRSRSSPPPPGSTRSAARAGGRAGRSWRSPAAGTRRAAARCARSRT